MFYNVLDGEAIFLKHDLPWGRCTKAIDAKHIAAVANVTMPSLRHPSLDSKPRVNRGQKNKVAVISRLSIEQIPAGHRDGACLDALFLQFSLCL